MQSIELNATPRELIGKKVKNLRNAGYIPGVIYGNHINPIVVHFDARQVERAYRKAGTSMTVQVFVEGTEEPYLAIFRDVQVHPLKRNPIHLDLQALSLTEKVRVPVPVVLVGIAPAVELGGVLLQVQNELEIEALPNELIPNIQIDISVLREIGQSINVANLNVPAGVTILNAPNSVVVQITYQEAEEIEATPAAAAVAAAETPAEPELIRKKRAEEEPEE